MGDIFTSQVDDQKLSVPQHGKNGSSHEEISEPVEQQMGTVHLGEAGRQNGPSKHFQHQVG
jgi:hypothetical protein